MTARWTDAFALSAVPVGGVKTLRHGTDRVAVFRLDAGTLHAVDDRCPHEGYPLSQGAVDGCTLTCCWHNWKFDLRDGACGKGGEDVRSYPLRVVDGTVQVDLAPPDPADQLPKLWASLDEGLTRYDGGRTVRDAVRLLQLGVAPAAIAAAAARHDAVYAEWGATHGLAVAADVLHWLPRYPGPQAAVPLAQALDVASFAHARRPIRPVADAADPGDDPVAAGVALRTAVEAEDLPTAEGLLRGALDRGWREHVEAWCFQLCADHFLGFGHRLIYQVKVFDLLRASDWAHAEDILVGHLAGIVYATREDVLPAWAGFRKRLDRLDLAALADLRGQDPHWDDREAVIDAVLGGTPAQAFDAVADAARAGAPWEALADALSLAAAERMIRFDVAIDSDQDVQDSWLSVTHIQTHAHAVRQALARWSDPQALRLLLFAARFAHHHRVLDGDERAPAAIAGTTDDLMAAIGRRDTTAAMALAGTVDLEALRPLWMDACIGDSSGRPIVQAHLIKGVIVAFDEAAATGDPRPLQAFAKLLSAPLQQRWVQRRALEAVAFLTTGRVPRLLAP
jgi:nitrite reductase/ring-hydroxylating ferredoxin subunit